MVKTNKIFMVIVSRALTKFFSHAASIFNNRNVIMDVKTFTSGER